MGLIVYESELRRLGRFRWNPNGFILIEFGQGGRSHFRLDLGNQGGRGKRVYAGGNYSFEVTSIHLKKYLGTDSDDAHTYWLYYYISYVGGGVWEWSKDYVKEEDNQTLKFRHMTAPADDAENGYTQMTDFLDDLGRQIGHTQSLSI